MQTPQPCPAARKTHSPQDKARAGSRMRLHHSLLLPSSLRPSGSGTRSEVRSGRLPCPSHLPQLTFEKDEAPVLALIGSTDVTGQTTPEVPNGHGIVIQDSVVPDPPEPAALGRAWVSAGRTCV